MATAHASLAHGIGACAYCANAQNTSVYVARHLWRNAPNGMLYTLCGTYTIEKMPAGFWQLFSRASRTYSRHATQSAAIASAR